MSLLLPELSRKSSGCRESKFSWVRPWHTFFYPYIYFPGTFSSQPFHLWKPISSSQLEMIPKGIPVLLNLWTSRLDESLLALDSISLSHSSPVQSDVNLSSRKGISAALVTCTSFSRGVWEDCFSLFSLSYATCKCWKSPEIVCKTF